MTRLSQNQYDSDGAVLNGFDYQLQVWVQGGMVQTCGHVGGWDKSLCRCCNAKRYATLAVKYIEGHQVTREN